MSKYNTWIKLRTWTFRLFPVFLLLLLASSCKGGDKEEFPVLQSSKVIGHTEETITIEISESVKDTKTTGWHYSDEAIKPTRLVTEGSHFETTTRLSKRHLEDIDGNRIDQTLENLSVDPRNRLDNADYDFIKPTRTQNNKNVKITATKLSGEELGVPDGLPGPQNMSSDRESRYFQRVQNKLESLGSLAKVSFNQPSNRESREEENRKANPDIQDIITGIVKILHGKANTQGLEIRPRPQSTRINNRGPPRIAEIPPLDLDAPPAYVPLQPPQPNRIPPPYPFDLPPSPPPLPPQPHKPNQNIPLHPFINGVPLPERVVPSNSSKLVPSKDEDEDKKLLNKTKIQSVKPPVKRVRPRPQATVKPMPETKPAVLMKPVTEIIPENKSTIIAPNSTSSAMLSISSISTVLVLSENRTTSDLPLMPTGIGIGEATPLLETSFESSTTMSSAESLKPTPSLVVSTSTEFKARPGIVLDDPEYKPGGHKRPVGTHKPVITAPPAGPYGEVFDVTVLAIQGAEGSSGKPVIVPVGGQVHGDVSVITKPQEGQDFVSIDGKRTYINLFGENTENLIKPSSTYPTLSPTSYPKDQNPPVAQQPPRRVFKKPIHPPVRIDTCIVGDDSTCDVAQNEMCRTEDGVSSCHCRPGYNRRKHRDSCRRIISLVTSLRVDRLYDRKITWKDSLKDSESIDYQELSYEAGQAMASAMSMTPFSDDYINQRINSIYLDKNPETNEPAVYVNMTLQFEENLDTARPAVRHDIQRHLLRVIHRRNNNVGNSAVWVDSPPGSVLALQDVDECSSKDWHDCHQRAICVNTFGSFKCQCEPGYRDPWLGNIHREGRLCESCGNDYCNNRGECRFERGQQVCLCSGSFYGTQCEVDGEVLGVAIGASVAAAIIIILTLVCLCMWSRRWSREQKTAVGVGMGSPVFGFMGPGPTVKTPTIGSPPYQVTLEERMRWAQLADAMAHANHYAPEPGTRTSFGGYPTLPAHSMAGTFPLPSIAPPVPLPRLTLPKSVPSTYGGISQQGSLHHSTHGMRASLETTSSSEEEDRTDLLGRNFNMPRPKSRTSIANQSGIYYDVDLERSEIYAKHNIPMNTYLTNTRQLFR